MTAPPFDLEETDRLLTTTRAVRRRLDLQRPVPRELLLDCVRIAQQAPTASNMQTWRWIFVTDAERRRALAELYRAASLRYIEQAAASADPATQGGRIVASARHLAQHLEQVPVLAIPCVTNAPRQGAPLAEWVAALGSILPAVWSFQLALRARGLGSCLTTFHLGLREQADALLGLPGDVAQVALLPVAYTLGTEFKPADRPPPETIVHWDGWGAREAVA